VGPAGGAGDEGEAGVTAQEVGGWEDEAAAGSARGRERWGGGGDGARRQGTTTVGSALGGAESWRRGRAGKGWWRRRA
jgi:hypothetical protein